MIRTVAGDIAAYEGLALVHEHLRIDLTHRLAAIVIGAEDEADVVADLRQAAAAHGLRLVVDLSVVGSGRDALAPLDATHRDDLRRSRRHRRLEHLGLVGA